MPSRSAAACARKRPDLRINAYFRTNLFESRTPQPHFINPNCFGEDAAHWLRHRMQGLRFGFSAVFQEDYGWGFWADGQYWVAVVLLEASGEPPQWLIGVDYDPGLDLKQRFFGKADARTIARLCAAIHAALLSEPRITELRWCDRAEQDCDATPD